MLGTSLLFSMIPDKKQRYMFAGMAVVFALFIKNFTVGLVIYWITTNLWTIGQQALIKSTMGHHFPHLQTSPKVTTKSSRRQVPRARVASTQPRRAAAIRQRTPAARSRVAAASVAVSSSERRRSESRPPVRRWPRLGGPRCTSSSVATRTSIGTRSSSRCLSEGERGVLGVGYEPVRVAAMLTVVPEARCPRGRRAAPIRSSP